MIKSYPLMKQVIKHYFIYYYIDIKGKQGYAKK